MGAEIVIDGRRYVNFAGSSYLGLSHKTEILEAGVAALRSGGSGYQFARHYEIASAAHQEVETEAAAFFSRDSGLYLVSGYSFGLIAIAGLRSRYTRIFFDELAHYCLRDGIATAGLPSHSFGHLDAEDLRAKLRQHLQKGERPLVVTDGLYSTVGEIAPVDELAGAIAPYDGCLLVDESHSFGVLGECGRGACEHHVHSATPVLVGGSTGKAFGVLGGIIPASHADVVALRGTPASRGATVGQPAAAAMCAASLRFVREHPELLSRLRENISYMKGRLRELGLDVGDARVPIASFALRSAGAMQALQKELMASGIHVLYSRYIGAGDAGIIRCGIFADHRREHFDCLVDALRRLL